ncbi:LamG-like jellyroll fold domain-containing protein [Chryseobacterium sp. c4a]|uniref:LamG-like jellyroll fold domain-containing protein n=1 Tax=Chryseobacterium sp. c4a TaxID=1573582 RepID=UPI001357AA41|nr:LamG-like jellyroll fold domain-containing protein [Chryseobacterium sp. c4a]
MATLVFLTKTFLYAQLEKTYISGQSKQVYGVCLLCSVENPQNIIGNNENDYATLRIPAGIYGRIEQTFILPALSPAYRKVTIGIETPNVSIKEQAKREIYIETFNGISSNNDRKRLDSNMLKPGSDPQKGTIEFPVTQMFDRIKLTVHSGLIGLGEELRIYYVQQLPTQFTTCGNPPLDPFYYYTFNKEDNDTVFGNPQDVIRNKIFPAPSSAPIFHNNLVCQEALSTGTIPSSFEMFIDPSLSQGSKTISFWARMEKPGAVFGFFGFNLQIAVNSSKVMAEQVPLDGPIQAEQMNTPGQLNHFTIVYDDTKSLCIYKNGSLATPSTPGEQRCINANPDIGKIDLVSMTLRDAKVDELIIYKRALSSAEVSALACSYGILPGCESNVNKNTHSAMQTLPAKETFTVSPNPTSGQISLEGSIPLAGSEISIRNTSGTEVYHSPFRSKTFELPVSIPGGVYMLTLQTQDKKIYTRKIILTR